MASAIFISYRRDDSEGEAGRLFDDLVRVFGRDAVFMDVTGIHPGRDFRQAIEDNVSQCAVLLAVIGPAWARTTDPSGMRRLDQPNDFVRLEIASALRRGTDVIPVLVHGAAMPAPGDLPADLQNLAFRNCVELTHLRWNSDVEALSRTLREYVHREVLAGSRTLVGTRTILRMIEGSDDPDGPAQASRVPAPDPPTAPPRIPPAPLRMAAVWMALVAAAALGAASYVFIHQQLKLHAREEAQLAPSGQGPASAAAPAGAPSGVSATTSPNPPQFQPLLGTWVNPQAQLGKPMLVQLSGDHGSLLLHLWIRCKPVPCDVGAKAVPVTDDGITTQWTGPFSNTGSEQAISQTVALTIYRTGPGLRIIYGSLTGFTGFDFVRQ